MVKIPPLLALLFQNNAFLLRRRGTITTLATCRPWNMSRSSTLTQASLSHLCPDRLPASPPALAGWAESRRGAGRDAAAPSASAWTRAHRLAPLFVFAPLLLHKWPN